MSERIKKLIGLNIKNRRKAASFSQEELGDMVNYSKQSISAFECGDRELKLYAAFNMAEALDCEVTDFHPQINELECDDPNPFDY